jgi:DNA-binding NarL/FixJ family response regulator
MDILRMLIADDDPHDAARARHAALAAAAAHGQACAVGIAASVGDALAWSALAGTPDVAIIDLMLPGGGGAALARALAALHPPPRCIAWSFIDPPACDAPWFIGAVHKDLDDAAVTAALAALLTP